MPATIRDVSKLAKVSSATVSRAFSDPDKLTKETLVRVRAAAEELDYKPNVLSTIFRSNKTNTILVMVPDLSNAFFGPVLAGLERVATDENYSLLLSDTRDDFDLEKRCIELLKSRRVDGVIQLGSSTIEELDPGANPETLAFVHAIENGKASKAPSVGIDNIDAARKIVDFLTTLGHRSIGLIGGHEDSQITRDRVAGYSNALKNADLEMSERNCEFATYSLAGGEAGAFKLLRRNPNLTAIFCLSDEIAIGAMKAANELGFKLPEELSIVGFDNIDFANYCVPTLTTVTQPAERLGELAMVLLMTKLKGEDGGKTQFTLPTELVVRSSAVAPLRG